MRPDRDALDSLAVTACALLLLLAAVGPALGAVATTPGDDGEYEVADGRQGGVDPGREDDEQQQFPINFTFFPVDHSPGVAGGSFEVYASGLSENIRGHWIVLRSGEFGLSNCRSSDASAFGIDRGNDDASTTTDKSLLTAFKSYESNASGIFIGFYKEEALAGSPVNATLDDQVVARQNNCVTNPSEPGWYRVSGYISGSTKFDTETDYRIYATSQYTYVCDCSSRQEAREQLGPPPNEQSGASTPTATATATPASTATSTATATATAEPTATPKRGTATPASQRNPDDGGGERQDGTATATATPESTATATSTPQSAAAASDRSTAVPTTPTLAEGPGFGPLLALVALAAGAGVALRRD